MKNIRAEIDEFFVLALAQLDKENTIPQGKKEVLAYVETLRWQVDWIIRDSDKVESDDPDMAKDLHQDTEISGFYMLVFEGKDWFYPKIHYAQLNDGNYHCIIENSDFKTQDLDELKAWITKKNTIPMECSQCKNTKAPAYYTTSGASENWMCADCYIKVSVRYETIKLDPATDKYTKI